MSTELFAPESLTQLERILNNFPANLLMRSMEQREKRRVDDFMMTSSNMRGWILMPNACVCCREMRGCLTHLPYSIS